MVAETLLTLRQLAHQLDLPESTVRYYRDAFLDHIPSVGSGRRRRYPPQAAAVLREIAGSYASGQSRAEIARSLDQNVPRTATITAPTQKFASSRSLEEVTNLDLLAAIVDGEREQRDALWQMAKEIVRLTEVLEGQDKVLVEIADRAGVTVSGRLLGASMSPAPALVAANPAAEAAPVTAYAPPPPAPEPAPAAHPTPAAPVAPVTPLTPAAPVAPVTPLTPAAPVAPMAPAFEPPPPMPEPVTIWPEPLAAPMPPPPTPSFLGPNPFAGASVEGAPAPDVGAVRSSGPHERMDSEMELLRRELEAERELVERLREAKLKLEHRAADAEAALEQNRPRRSSVIQRILGKEPGGE